MVRNPWFVVSNGTAWNFSNLMKLCSLQTDYIMSGIHFLLHWVCIFKYFKNLINIEQLLISFRECRFLSMLLAENSKNCFVQYKALVVFVIQNIHTRNILFRITKCWSVLKTSVSTNLTFIGPCIVRYFHSKTNQMHQCLKFILLESHSICF